MRRLIAVTILGLLVGALFAEVTFSGLDLTEQDQLLFTATADAPGYGSYRTLVHADLSGVPDRSSDRGVAGGEVLTGVGLTQLTHFPEILTYLPASRSVQVQNRFGVFRASVDERRFEPVTGFAGFTTGATITNGRVLPVTASPDGRYLVVVEPTGAAYGDLVLVATDGSARSTVASGIELSTETSPARWSPDSRFFVYGRSGSVYYFSIDQYEGGRLLGESFRELGPGSIASVRWSSDSSLYYVRGSLVYEVLGPEFFARSLYAGLLQVGTIIGKLPFPFDPNFDSFVIGPDGETALLNKGGRNLFVLFLNPDDFVDSGRVLGLPSLFLPRNTRVRQIAWSVFGDVTILTGSAVRGPSSSAVFRLNTAVDEASMTFERTEDRGVVEIRLAPDDERIALLTETEVVFRNHRTWSPERRVSAEAPLHAAWLDSARLLVGGRSTISVVSATDGTRTLLGLAQADEYSISDDGTIRAAVSGSTYEYRGRWLAVDQPPEESRSVAGDRFRVFLEALSSGSYRNIVMARRATDAGTGLVFAAPERGYEPFPGTGSQTEEATGFDGAYFTHGSRIRRREISLVFNAVDNVEGLTEILSTLAGYGIRATFFVNGEFIRRHPAALGEIAGAGHEVGSLFFAHFDMADRRFRLTADFIRDGLSRNEDDYFAATGRELSLLWHAPHYFVSEDIVDAGRTADYVYVGRDVDSLDWVPRLTDEGLSRLYMPSSRLVERILEEKMPGSIVSMQVGVLDEVRGGREDYLFQRLDILINGLLDRGYTIVPVSTLIEHAR